jgi:16S rRNA (guanine527-N7)-methyltransferase
VARTLPLDAALTEDRARALALTPVSRETAGRLDAFVALLLRWQATTNLVAPSTLPQLWTRHVADSLQLLALAPSAKVWADLGSGGGFPGLVIACALAGTGATVHLVESSTKKAAFLREATRATGAPVIVHPVRIEDFTRSAPPVDVVTARALAPLPTLLGYIAPLMKENTRALVMKGQDVGVELTEASKYWRVDAKLVPSVTDTAARIVVIHKLARAT